ncbi:MAG: tetratricopeptide repeat protein [Planctomycetes bacterium]|nr:tetratricopeptide repeat protein [Planctomycetota bacterium]
MTHNGTAQTQWRFSHELWRDAIAGSTARAEIALTAAQALAAELQAEPKPTPARLDHLLRVAELADGQPQPGAAALVPLLQQAAQAAREDGDRQREATLRRMLLRNMEPSGPAFALAAIETALVVPAVEATALCRQAAQVAERAQRLDLQARATATEGQFFRQQRRLQEAEARGREGLELARASSSEREVARALNLLALTLRLLARKDEAFALSEESERLFRVLGDLAGVAKAAHLRAQLHQDEGDLARALEDFAEVLDLQELAGEKLAAARTRGNIGYTHWRMGNLAEARRHMEAAVDAMRAGGARRDQALGHQNLGSVAMEGGDYARAAHHYARLLELALELGATELEAHGYGNLAVLALNLGDRDGAAAAVKQAQRAMGGSQQPDLRCLILDSQARLHLLDGNPGAALPLLRQSEELATKNGLLTWLGDCMRLQAEAHAARGAADQARGCAQAALEAFDQAGAGRSAQYAFAVALAADMEARCGNSEDARFLAQDADSLLRALNYGPDHPDPDVRRAINMIRLLA